MTGFGFWPVAVQPLGNVASGTVLWRVSGRLHATVVVKAAFELVADGVARPTSPRPVQPSRGEMAPYLGLTDVVVTAAHAHAFPPTPVTAVAVRVAVIRDWPLLDKRLLVYGDNPRIGAGRSLFTKAPVVAADDPVGRPGVLLNPREPNQPVTLGWLSQDDPYRLSLLGGRPPPEPVAGVMDIEEGFPWEFFQVAPPDQRIPYLRGDEWIVLDGFHPTQPRIQCRLPGGHAEVRVYPPSMQATDGATWNVAMQLDRLNIDADAMRCSLLWRGSFPVADESSARALTLLAALTIPGGPTALPQTGQPIEQPLSKRPAPAPSSAPKAQGLSELEEVTDSNAETRKLLRVRPPAASASSPTHELPPSDQPMVDDGATTVVYEPSPTIPSEPPSAASSEPLDDSDLGPPTELLVSTPTSPDLLRVPSHDPSAPVAPLKAKPTMPYFEGPDERPSGGRPNMATKPMRSVGHVERGGAAADLQGSRPGAPIPSQEDDRDDMPSTTRLDGENKPSSEGGASAPAQSGVARRKDAPPIVGSVGRRPDVDGAVTHVQEPTSDDGDSRAPRARLPILPSRAELPMYLPSEAKRWARVAPKSTPPRHGAMDDEEVGPPSQLELTSEGALSVRFLADAELDSAADDDEEPPTAVAPSLVHSSARSRAIPLQRGAGTGPLASGSSLGWTEAKQYGATGHVLRPQPIPGAPWSAGPSPTRASVGPPSAASISPSDLPLVSVEDLEGTLSETLSVRDTDVEIIDEESSVSEASLPLPLHGILDEETSVSEVLDRRPGAGIVDEETSVSEGLDRHPGVGIVDEDTSVSEGSVAPGKDRSGRST